VEDCAHEWEDTTYVRNNDQTAGVKQRTNIGAIGRDEPIVNATCNKCHAWYGELGLEPTPEQYVANMVEVFREVRRVLRGDGNVWLNMGDSYASQPAGNITPSGFSQTRPSRRKHGVGSETVDIPARKFNSLKPKDLVGIPWRIAFALQADGWWLRSDIIWSKPNPMPESVTDRPTKAHEYLFLLTKSARYYYDADAVREEADTKELEYRNRIRLGKEYDVKEPYQKNFPTHYSNTSGRNRRTVWTVATQPYSGSHFATFPVALVEPCIKAGTSERGVCPECGGQWERVVERRDKRHWTERNEYTRSKYQLGNNKSGRNDGRADFAIPSIDTLGWRPTCDHDHEPVPAIVFDPFAGSGTTLLVARQLGRHGVGIDLSAEYLQLARERLSLDALEDWEMGKAVDGGDIELGQHKNMTVPGRQPHSFHVERVKGKKDGKGELTDLPLFGDTPPAKSVPKQDQVGKRTYTGFNKRWKDKQERVT
jgi:DNA modification methylase